MLDLLRLVSESRSHVNHCGDSCVDRAAFEAARVRNHLVHFESLVQCLGFQVEAISELLDPRVALLDGLVYVGKRSAL